jgi:hypothetical protein
MFDSREVAPLASVHRGTSTFLRCGPLSTQEKCCCTLVLFSDISSLLFCVCPFCPGLCGCVWKGSTSTCPQQHRSALLPLLFMLSTWAVPRMGDCSKCNRSTLGLRVSRRKSVSTVSTVSSRYVSTVTSHTITSAPLLVGECCEFSCACVTFHWAAPSGVVCSPCYCRTASGTQRLMRSCWLCLVQDSLALK